MSDHENKNELTPAGKATEAMLHSMTLPTSDVNRDVLMYEAGYSAALAQLNQSTAVQQVVQRRAGFVWPALTVAFASTAAVCLAMLYVDREELRPVETEAIAVIAANDGQAQQEVDESLELGASSRLSLKSIFGIPFEMRYRHRLSNTIRDLDRRVTPVSLEVDGADEFDSMPLTPGSFIDVDELFDGLL